MRKSVEDIVVAIGVLVFGIVLISLGIYLIEEVIIGVTLIICGTVFDVYALQFLTRRGK